MKSNKELSLQANELTKSPQSIFFMLKDLEILKNKKTVVYKDGSYKIVEDGITWEYENDENYLVTI